MFTYIRKDVIGNYISSEIAIETLDGYQDSLGTEWEDYLEGKFLKLSDEQLEFKEEHPEASVKEVWDMELVPPREKTLEEAQQEKIDEISRYDCSSAVNEFYLGETGMWLEPAERTNYLNTLQGAQRLGVEEVEFMGMTIPVTMATIMIDQINLYAMQCVGVTAHHKAAVMSLETVQEVEDYDYTLGYPTKLVFGNA